VKSLLTTYYGIETGAAGKVADLAHGSIKRAIELSASYDDKERRAAYELLEHVLDESESRVIERATVCARGAGRDGAARILHELGMAYRDIMCGEETLFVNRDYQAFLAQQTLRWDRKKLPWILERISRAHVGILQRNLNIEATLVDLFLAIKRSGC
jgi:hypothetical protein